MLFPNICFLLCFLFIYVQTKQVPLKVSFHRAWLAPPIRRFLDSPPVPQDMSPLSESAKLFLTTAATDLRPQISEESTSAPTETTDLTQRNHHLLPLNCGVETTTKIFGGSETRIDEFPWMALIRKSENGTHHFICGGTLISTRYILTAAHCVTELGGSIDEKVDKIRLGDHDLRTNKDCQGKRCNRHPQNMGIEEIIVHPGYKRTLEGIVHDIALIRMQKLVKVSPFVQPICLPWDELQFKTHEGQYMWASGWGLVTDTSASPTKLKVALPILPTVDCVKIFKKYKFVGNEICAGGEPGKDSCAGDSGGPLMTQDVMRRHVRWIQYGIISYGLSNCGSISSPGVYTSVGTHMPWILDNIRP